MSVAFAIALAKDGLPVFPVLATKAPACSGGHKAAAMEISAVVDLWRRHPAPLIGVPTGQISGIDVLDLDLAKHALAADWWREHHQALLLTRVHRTRSGGLHLVFRHADGLRCNVARLCRGVDVRADGGFVVWWPAAGQPVVHDVPPSAWPDWLLAGLVAVARSGEAPRIHFDRRDDFAHCRYAMGALRRGVERVATAPEGMRNATLNAETFSLARLVEAGVLSAIELAEAMAAAALTAGLSAAEIRQTVASALRGGLAE